MRGRGPRRHASVAGAPFHLTRPAPGRTPGRGGRCPAGPPGPVGQVDRRAAGVRPQPPAADRAGPGPGRLGPRRGRGRHAGGGGRVVRAGRRGPSIATADPGRSLLCPHRRAPSYTATRGDRRYPGHHRAAHQLVPAGRIPTGRRVDVTISPAPVGRAAPPHWRPRALAVVLAAAGATVIWGIAVLLLHHELWVTDPSGRPP